MTVYQGNHDKKVLSSGLSCAHLTQTRNCGDGGAFEVPSFCGPDSCKLGLSATCLRSQCPVQHSKPWLPNSCPEDPSTRAVRGIESCFLPRQTQNKEYKLSHQWTAEGLAVPPPPLPPFPIHSNFPLRAGCPFCVRCHSTRCRRWGPRAMGPRIPCEQRPLWRVPRWARGQMGKVVGRKIQTKSYYVVSKKVSKDPQPLFHSSCHVLKAPNPTVELVLV